MGSHSIEFRGMPLLALKKDAYGFWNLQYFPTQHGFVLQGSLSWANPHLSFSRSIFHFITEHGSSPRDSFL